MKNEALKMNILITGGAGYLGTELARRLSKDPQIDKIIIFDNLARKNYNLFITADPLANKIEIADCELLDSRSLRKYVNQADVVYHLAAKVATPHADQDPHLFEQTNHWGTAELVYAVEESDSIKKLIYASSASVYGSGDQNFEVDDQLNPRTFYAISKMRGEKQIDRIKNKQDTYIFRLGNIFGYSSSMRFDAVINKFMLNAHFKNSIDIHGNGEQLRPFVHIDNAAETLHRSLYNDFAPATYNVVGQNVSIKSVVNDLKILYPDLETKYINQHLALRSLSIKGSKEIIEADWWNNDSLLEDLKNFQTNFAFSPNAMVLS